MASRAIGDLHPKFQPLVRRFLEACKQAGIDLIITSGLRTFEEQAQLYAQGRTAPGRRVTNAKPGDSWHNYGLAIDVVAVRGTKALWNGPWEQIGMLGERHGLIWGGRFTKLRDRPHFEWHPGLTISEAAKYVQMGYRPTEIPIREG